MILTKKEILNNIASKNIEIMPFSEDQLCYNGFNFRLGRFLYKIDSIDEEYQPKTTKIDLVDYPNGYILQPQFLYLGATSETYKCDVHAQLLYGSKSIGQLGIWVHISAPLAHVGSSIKWTLELKCVQKVKIYFDMIFGKIYFLKNLGEILPYGSDYYFNSGKYVNNKIEISKKSFDKY